MQEALHHFHTDRGLLLIVVRRPWVVLRLLLYQWILWPLSLAHRPTTCGSLLFSLSHARIILSRTHVFFDIFWRWDFLYFFLLYFKFSKLFILLGFSQWEIIRFDRLRSKLGTWTSFVEVHDGLHLVIVVGHVGSDTGWDAKVFVSHGTNAHSAFLAHFILFSISTRGKVHGFLDLNGFIRGSIILIDVGLRRVLILRLLPSKSVFS